MHDTGNSNGNMGGLQPSPQAFSLDPLSARSLGESISRRVSLGEYLSVTSQLMVAGPGMTEPKMPGDLGWVELCSSWNPLLWNLT